MASVNEASRVASPEPKWRTKYVHEMTAEERLESLKEWAEEKKYIQPGEGGTLGLYNVGAMAFGGPLRTIVSESQRNDRWAGQYEAPVGPPSYQMTSAEDKLDAGNKKTGPFRRWVEKRKTRKDAKRNASVPASNLCQQVKVDAHLGAHGASLYLGVMDLGACILFIWRHCRTASLVFVVYAPGEGLLHELSRKYLVAHEREKWAACIATAHT